MRTEEVTPELATQIERAEIRAWLDLYAAAPADFVAQYRPEILRAGGVILTRCAAIPFVHFNCVMNLGVGEPATEPQLDAVLAQYREAGVSAFAVYHNPYCRPRELAEWLQARGLKARGGWDRIYRGGAPPTGAIGDSPGFSPLEPIEKVTHATAAEWTGFLDGLYRLPAGPWLRCLVGRPGWHHYLLRSSGKIVAARTMYLHADGMAWLGIEAPVPGVMAPSFELDRRICREIVRDGLELGAKCFVADIEAPSAEMNTLAYAAFDSLGFRKLYLRRHYRV
jgi:hypothetical protein